MKLAILNAKKEHKGDQELPKQFGESVRPDLIARAVRALQAQRRQPYGADPRAGKRASAELSRRRRKYRGSYGSGISRVPRKILTRRGIRMYWVGAFAPGTVGGRRAHPPKAAKRWVQKLNVRERRKAIRSALAAVMNRDLVVARGHRPPQSYPFILDSSIELIAKTKDAEAALSTLGFDDELARCERTKVRAGKATMRGRRKKRPTGILLVVGEKNVPLIKAAGNIAGLEVVHVRALNTELLAPGTHPGRVTLFTTSALKIMQDEGLFLDVGKRRLSAQRKEPEAPPAKASGGVTRSQEPKAQQKAPQKVPPTPKQAMPKQATTKQAARQATAPEAEETAPPASKPPRKPSTQPPTQQGEAA
ncbi:50S ribosomal protein L4 [Candidatus Woesearchaeota archaeon]|nr:MAG: 50S ribosomal protein L4 [Candidatus Woesearchaeota archaeon]